ncbi:LLM class flavin-dependent oxidoreductase [Brachybacterium sp. ACRRE]|uniref:LLM class flavin-dependent oxidoreductase n=1 Tax=Brachybacterium sp. ACRRE TaxID=2918184 RepID=UPI001EF362F3|nr:LLM class flavin-dependent oxidoreductase [Brachybacterium sp. ACRRE]MCG7308539.1 LLM class flavin-dependent oxidoreductase [Brachybacterium sp. ACRRE]
MTTPPVLTVDLPSTPARLGAVRDLARALDAAGLGALSISGDAERGDLHPIHVASHLAPLTRALSLVVRTDAVDVEPFHLATQLMSLDHISGGRAGWLVETRTDDAAAHVVGREALDPETARRETSDVVTVARLVWDSWSDDAVVRDAETGVYVDAAKLQYVDFEGESFSVRGPSITPRSPQGLLPVLVADADRPAVGDTVAEQLADGRAVDVVLDPDTTAQEIAGAVREALGAAGIVGAELDPQAADTAAASAAPSTPRLVRLVGLLGQQDPADDVAQSQKADAGEDAFRPAELASRVADAAAQLRADGLVAPAPSAGATLRAQFGLPRPDVTIDPARRSDRARTAQKEIAR